MQFRLRTLLIVLALAPPLLAIGYWNWEVTVWLIGALLPLLGALACWFDAGPVGPPIR